MLYIRFPCKKDLHKWYVFPITAAGIRINRIVESAADFSRERDVTKFATQPCHYYMQVLHHELVIRKCLVLEVGKPVNHRLPQVMT